MGADERELAELLRIKKRRLAELNKQIARLGYEAPPHLVTERDDLKTEVEKDRQALEPVIKGELSDEALAALRSYGVPAAVSNAMLLLEQGLADFKQEFRAYRDQRFRETEKDYQQRVDRQIEVDEKLDQVSKTVRWLSWRQWAFSLVVVIIATYLLTRGGS